MTPDVLELLRTVAMFAILGALVYAGGRILDQVRSAI